MPADTAKMRACNTSALYLGEQPVSARFLPSIYHRPLCHHAYVKRRCSLFLHLIDGQCILFRPWSRSPVLFFFPSASSTLPFRQHVCDKFSKAAPRALLSKTTMFTGSRLIDINIHALLRLISNTVTLGRRLICFHHQMFPSRWNLQDEAAEGSTSGQEESKMVLLNPQLSNFRHFLHVSCATPL